MKAIQIHRPNDGRDLEVPDPKPGPDDVPVEVE
jgi:hypothetical protein